MFRIAIIGAGPAGLTLANLLLKSRVASQISMTIFERDSSAKSRSYQGGTLDLHAETGLAALHKADLLTPFQKLARYDGDEIYMADLNNTVLVHKGATTEAPDHGRWNSGDYRPEIDRADLGDLLRSNLPADLVRWGHRLQSCSENATLQFLGEDNDKNIQEGPFDLVVGAEGAWSKVREHISSAVPTYSGISGYEMTIPAPAKTNPPIHEMAGKGAYMANSDGKFLNCQRMGNGSLKVRSWFRCDEFVAQERLDKLGPEGVVKEILSRYEGWSPELLELLTAADSSTMRVWPCYELPIGHTWVHKKGYTLLGDAASLAAPFSGEGVNKAMRDALDLANFLEEALSKDVQGDRSADIDAAVQKYEAARLPRATKVQKSTRAFMGTFFSGRPLPTAIPQMIATMVGNSDSTFFKIVFTLFSPILMPLAAAYFSAVAKRGAEKRKEMEKSL